MVGRLERDEEHGFAARARAGGLGFDGIEESAVAG